MHNVGFLGRWGTHACPQCLPSDTVPIRPVMTMTPFYVGFITPRNFLGDDTLGQGTSGAWHVLPSISVVDSVTCLRYAECSRAPDYIINGHGFPMQTISCTWR